MHPWRTTSVPDIGKFLYRQVHSLHHKSYNPTAFSGTNMHPVEATLYYSAALIPVCLGVHPVHSLAVIVDCAMGAWLGHDGFMVRNMMSDHFATETESNPDLITVARQRRLFPHASSQTF